MMNTTGNIFGDGIQQLLNATVSISSQSFSPDLTTATYIDVTTDYYDGLTFDYDEAAQSEVCNYTQHSATFLPILYSTYFLFGLLGNGLVVWVIMKGAQLRSMTDVCLLNLALADLLLVISLPFLAHQARDHWVFGDAMCKLVLGVYYVGYYSGIFFITLMAVDRYLAVVHAVHALRIRTRTYGIIASIVVWIASILSLFPEVTALKLSAGDRPNCYRDYQGKDHLRSVSFFKMNILGFVVPLAILFFCYTQILLKLLHSRLRKGQAVRLIVVVMVVFLCCWAPYNVTLFFWWLHNQGFFSDCDSSKSLLLSLQVTEVMAYTHCCLNPVLYVFVGEKFRRRFLRLLSKSPCVRCGFVKAYLTTASGSVYSRASSMEERSTQI